MSTILVRLCALLACAVATAYAAGGEAQAGSLSWTDERTSPAINYAEQDTVVQYGEPGRLQGRITRVHASRTGSRDTSIASHLCWNTLDHCVPLIGSAVSTNAFNGRDASRAFYLVHRVKGKGALSAPLFVKGSVIVWYGP